MLGTVGGHPKQIVTNVSVQMSHNFSKIMQQLLQEANEGRFATKSEAVQRRDNILKTQPAAPADSGTTAAPEPASQAPTEPDHYEDGQQLPDDSMDLW